MPNLGFLSLQNRSLIYPDNNISKAFMLKETQTIGIYWFDLLKHIFQLNWSNLFLHLLCVLNYNLFMASWQAGNIFNKSILENWKLLHCRCSCSNCLKFWYWHAETSFLVFIRFCIKPIQFLRVLFNVLEALIFIPYGFNMHFRKNCSLITILIVHSFVVFG